MRLTETYDNLIEKLKTKEEYFDENGELLKSKVIYEAQNDSEEILELLLSDVKLSNTYFKTVKDTKIFLKDKFINTINHKEFFPSSYTSYLNYIGLSDGTDYIKKSKNIVLNFPYKDCILEGGQSKEEQSLKEFFYNETLANDEVDRLLHPKVFTNIRKYTKDGVEENPSFKHTDNLLIKGNNLIALHSLVKRYEGRVKLIYIDPPYNTGGVNEEFLYNNKFNHSSWLTFMKNRLEIAKKLLSDDGAMIIAIDKNEQIYLGILISEIFKEYESHCITIVHNPRGAQGTNFSYTNEFAFFIFPKGKKIIYDRKITNKDEIEWSNFRNWGSESERKDAKNCFYPLIIEKDKIVGYGDVLNNDIHPKSQTEKVGNKYYIYPIDNNGIERKWRYAHQSIDSIIHLLRAKKVKDGYQIEIGKDFEKYKTVWIDEKYDANVYGKQLLRKYVPNSEFSFPKSLYTVMDCINAVVRDDKEAIILDFFGGSGTTAHSVLEINNNDSGKRQFILTEQMFYIEDVIKERLVNVIKEHKGGEFLFMEIMKNNQSYIDTITECTSSSQLIEIKNELKNSNFIRYEVKDENLFDDKNQFDTLSMDEQKEILIKILDKNHLYVNYSEMDDTQFDISDEVKKFNREFYEVK